MTGDWNGSGTVKAAIYKDGLWRFNRKWDGPSADREYSFASEGEGSLSEVLCKLFHVRPPGPGGSE